MNLRFPKKFLSVLVLVISGISLVFAWGAWGHQYVNRSAVFALPDEMGPFFYNHIDFVTEESVVPDIRKHDLNDKDEYSRHFINLETFEEGDVGIDSLPRTMPQARLRYGEAFLQANGMLPWYIQEITDKLTVAFRNKRKSEILFLAADLGHYIADAYMPLHTSLNHDGQLTGQKGIHAFWEGQLPELFGKNYNFYTGKAKFVPDITKQTWQIIATSYRLVDTLLQADRQLKNNLSINRIFQTDTAGNILKNKFKDPIHTVEYATRYHGMLHGMVEKQLRGAIAATADYWYTAWVNAGKPDLTQLDPESLTNRNKSNYQNDSRLWKQGTPPDIKPDKEF
jgi:hypothetical protein